MNETDTNGNRGERKAGRRGARAADLSPSVRELLDSPPVARWLGVEDKTLANWRSARKGPKFVRVGGLVRYRPADVEAWIEANVVTQGDR